MTWLLQHLISVSVLVALVWLICLGLKNRPAWRHALWLVVLIKLVTPPAVEWPWSVDEITAYVAPAPGTETVTGEARENEPLIPATEPDTIAPLPDEIVSTSEFTPVEDIAPASPPPLKPVDLPIEPISRERPELEESFAERPPLPTENDGESASRVAIEMDLTSAADEPGVSAPVITQETIRLTLDGLLGLWIAGSAVVLIVQLRRMLRRRAVILRGESPTQELVTEIERVSRELQMKPVRAIVVRESASPFLWCLGRPKLAWPSDMSDGETLEESRGIIAHELAHIRRRDHWVTWLEFAAGVVWWWNPLFWLVRSRLREASEMACDAVALSLYDERKTYAELFLKLSTNLQTGAAAPVLGVSTGNRSAIERRIRMIMSDRVSGKMSGWGVFAVICFAVGVLPSLSVGEDVPATEPEAAPAISEDEFMADAQGGAAEESDALRKKVRQAIEFTRHRYLDASRHTPWQIMHGILALRDSYQIKVDGETVNALEWIKQRHSYNGEPWIEKTRDGARFHPFTKPYIFEGHPNQFLAILAMLDLPRDFTFETSGGPVSIAEMVEHAKMTVNDDEEPTWTLWALSKYLPSNAYWHNARGEVWTIERLVEKQSRADFDKSACGGTLGLLVLAHARNQHLDQGRKLYGAWIEADQVIKQHIELARDLQHPDGMFSCGYFAKRDYKEDFAERLSANGHTLEFLMMAVPDEELETPWIRKGVEAVANDLIANRRQPVDCGPLYHAVSGLVLYLERTSPVTVTKVTTTGPPPVREEVAAEPPANPSILEPVAVDEAKSETDAARESSVADRLNGTWVLTDRRVSTNPQANNDFGFVMINIDTKRERVIGCWKRGEETGFSECRITIETTHSPFRLVYDFGHGFKMLKIFDLNKEQLRIACYQDDRIASTKTPTFFDDPNSKTEPVVIETFERPKPVSHVAPAPAPASKPLTPARLEPTQANPFKQKGDKGSRSPSTPSSGAANPLTALMGQAQPAKAKPPRDPEQADESLGAELLGSQTLPNVTVSNDAEVRKLQRRWLEINVESTKAAYESASKDYEFKENLSRKGVITSREMEQAKSELRQTEAQLERAKILLELFELHVKRMKVSVGTPFPPGES